MLDAFQTQTTFIDRTGTPTATSASHLAIPATSHSQRFKLRDRHTTRLGCKNSGQITVYSQHMERTLKQGSGSVSIR